MEFQVTREFFGKATDDKEGYTLGSFFSNDVRLCYTLEDEDRHLELPGSEKVYGRTCIPRGRYPVVVDKSDRFSKKAGHDVYLPHILDVPGFDGIRIHGGNHAEDVLGCIAIGYSRTADGVANCAPAVSRLIELIEHAAEAGEKCWITIS